MVSIDFGATMRRSWDLAWKNKWLWVYGLVIAALTGSSYSSFNNSFNSSKSTKPSVNAQKIVNDAITFVTTWLKQVPPQTWALLVVGILLSIILGIIVRWVALAWAQGALIGGLNDADENKTVTLKTTTTYGIKSLKDLIIFSVISALIWLGIIVGFLAVFGLVALALSFSKALMIVWLVTAGFLVLLTIFVASVLFAMISVYAQRLIVLEGIKPWDAWKKGLSLSKGNFLNTVLMGLLNSVVGCVVGCGTMVVIVVILGIPALVFAFPFFSGNFPPVSFVGLGLLTLIGLWANFIIRAALVVFNYSNWNLLFKAVRGDK